MDDRLILVVDDDPASRYSLETFLRSVGFPVIAAENGVEAVEVAGSRQPKLIFMDVTMPEMDGFSATRAIHAQRVTACTPVVGVSADSDAQHRSMAFEAGMIEFIPKPWGPAEIRRVLGQLLPTASDTTLRRAG